MTDLPWSLEVEQAVLGAMLLDPDAAVAMVTVLDEPVFYRDAHRSLIALGHQTVMAGHSGAPAKEVLDATEAAVFRLADDKPEQEFVRAKTTLWPVMAHIEHLAQRGEDCTGVPSGFKGLDRMTAGFQPGDLVIVAARPSMGKTAFAMQVVEYAAEAGTGCGIFSMEMSREALIQRMLCGLAKGEACGIALETRCYRCEREFDSLVPHTLAGRKGEADAR